MKTIREWLEELPEPQRSEALENTEKEQDQDGINILDNKDKEDTSEALKSAFIWQNTKQGHSYWASFYKSLS